VIRRLARQALAAFIALRVRRRAEREAIVLARRIAVVDPEIPRLRQQIEDRCRRFQNAEPLRRELRARVTARLAREQGRTLQERRFS
jgi:hypothetical protein